MPPRIEPPENRLARCVAGLLEARAAGVPNTDAAIRRNLETLRLSVWTQRGHARYIRRRGTKEYRIEINTTSTEGADRA